MVCLLISCALRPAQAVGRAQLPPARPAVSSAPRGEGQPDAHPPGEPGVFKTQLARLKIPDAEMIDQEGRRVRLYSDLIKHKVVVLNFFFTRCVNVCLTQGVTLKNLKARLGERFGRDIFFISISKDPGNDDAARLKRWGAEFGAGHGWALLTGDEGVVNTLSMGMTAEEAGYAMHSPTLIVGNDRTGVWAKASGEATTDELIAVVERVAGSASAPQK